MEKMIVELNKEESKLINWLREGNSPRVMKKALGDGVYGASPSNHNERVEDEY